MNRDIMKYAVQNLLNRRVRSWLTVLSILIGIMAIFVYILIVYGWRNADVTLSVLISFMVVLGFFMKLVDYALSLLGIAAVVLSI